MRPLTSKDSFALLVAPIVFDELLGPDFRHSLEGWHTSLVLYNPRFDVQRLSAGGPVELVLRLDATFDPPWGAPREIDVILSYTIDVRADLDQLELELRCLAVASVTRDGEVDREPHDPFEKVVSLIVKNRPELGRKFAISLAALDALKTSPDQSWQFAIELQPEVRTEDGKLTARSAIVLVGALGVAPRPLPSHCRLPPSRRVALAIEGDLVCASLNRALTTWRKDARLPLGLETRELEVEMAEDALRVVAVVMRRYFGSTFGATAVRVHGRVRIAYEQPRRNFRLDARGLSFDIQPGLPGLAILALPLIASAAGESLMTTLRRRGPTLVSELADGPLDAVERRLDEICDDFQRVTKGLVLTLRDAGFRAHALWVTADVAR